MTFAYTLRPVARPNLVHHSFLICCFPWPEIQNLLASKKHLSSHTHLFSDSLFHTSAFLFKTRFVAHFILVGKRISKHEISIHYQKESQSYMSIGAIQANVTFCVRHRSFGTPCSKIQNFIMISIVHNRTS